MTVALAFALGLATGLFVLAVIVAVAARSERRKRNATYLADPSDWGRS